jgi:NAD(P)H-quinone oxidoreductase subunit 6
MLDFLAAAQVLIYVGAINVLIVFAIMLVNKPEKETNKKQITFGDILSGSFRLWFISFSNNNDLKHYLDST